MNSIQETCAALLNAFSNTQYLQLVAFQINPVPETKGMLLAGLALVCAIIRRRKRTQDHTG
jgi:hypothetical protein